MGKKDQPKLSKKELKKLEKKALKKAERKAEKKAAEHRAAATKGMKKAKVRSAEHPTESAASASGAVEGSSERHPHLKHLDRVGELTALLDPDQPKKVRDAAQKELDALRANGEKINAKKSKPTEDEQAEDLKARIAEARGESAPSDDDKPGSTARLRALQKSVEQTRQTILLENDANDSAAERAARASKITLGDVTPEVPTTAREADGEDERAATVAIGEAAGLVEVSAPGDNAVENDPTQYVFGKPSEAPKVDFEQNGLSQYLVKRPDNPEGMEKSDPRFDPRGGKLVGYTRTTTYIDNLEDKSALTKWKMRMLLEGAAADLLEANQGGERTPLLMQVNDLAHRRDVTIMKARKQDRKGRLQPGQLGAIVDGAWGDFKRAMDKLADQLFELGGGREKATKGTDIHALCDLYDTKGIDAVQEKLENGEITPADFADVEAYAHACKSLGLKVVATEQVIVNDALGVAGRLDRVYLAKLPAIIDPKSGEVLRVADTRAKRYVGDVKTGRIDYGQAKIAQQIRMYAESDAYDLNTHERTSHGGNRTLGLVIHLPAGSAKAEIFPVLLDIGDRGNKLSGQVRAFRNEGRKAIIPVDLVEAENTAREKLAMETTET